MIAMTAASIAPRKSVVRVWNELSCCQKAPPRPRGPPIISRWQTQRTCDSNVRRRAYMSRVSGVGLRRGRWARHFRGSRLVLEVHCVNSLLEVAGDEREGGVARLRRALPLDHLMEAAAAEREA